MEFVRLLPASVELCWFFFEDGEFARATAREFADVTILEMSPRLAGVARNRLALSAVADVALLTLKLSRKLRAARPDVVLTNSMKAHIVGSLAAKLAGLACINYLHDIVVGRALTVLRSTSRLCATERLTCSAAAKRQLNLPRTSVAYAAIDIDKFANLPEKAAARRSLGIPVDDVPVVAIVGRIARWKRQDLFIRIAARLAPRADVYFCIVGSPIFGVDAQYVKELEETTERAGLRERVFFIPWQEDLRTVYAAVDLSCNCSIREPFGRTSLEALASGVPIVCFDDAGICEVFEQDRGGRHVAVDDEVAFADAVYAYVSDPVLMRSASALARRTAEPLDAKLAFQIFSDAVNRVASASRRAAAPIAPGRSSKAVREDREVGAA